MLKNGQRVRPALNPPVTCKKALIRVILNCELKITR